MSAVLTVCEGHDGLGDLDQAVTVLLRGVDLKITGVLEAAASVQAHDDAWQAWRKAHTHKVKEVMAATYAAVENFDIQAVLTAARRLDGCGDALAESVLDSMDGARHQRVLTKVRDLANGKSPVIIPAAAAFAIKGALFHSTLPAAQLAYFHHEWRASAAGLLRRDAVSLERFVSLDDHRQLVQPQWAATTDSTLAMFQNHG